MARTQEKDVEQAFASEKERQLAEERVTITIPMDPLNKQKTVWVCLNGVEWYLAVGKPIEVPKSIAEVWNESYSKTMQAQANMEKSEEI